MLWSKYRRYTIVTGLGLAGVAYWVSSIQKSREIQKIHSPVFKAMLHHLRHDEGVKKLLGESIVVDDSRSVSGKFNSFKGIAEFQVAIKGEKQKAIVDFKANRISSDCDTWDSSLFLVTTADGSSLSL